jgi:hypothetical protein
VLGGGAPSRPECGDGWFVEPTIFDGVRNRMRIAQEESVRPGAVGDSVQGRGGGDRDRQRRRLRLAAGVWTQNMRRALTMAERLQAGTVWINTYRAVSYCRRSAATSARHRTRERAGVIKEYLQVKSVWILDRHRHAESVHPPLSTGTRVELDLFVPFLVQPHRRNFAEGTARCILDPNTSIAANGTPDEPHLQRASQPHSYCSVLSPAFAFAQAGSTAQISGTSRTRAGVSCRVSMSPVTQTATSFTRSAVSDVNGGYVLPNLPVGPYRLEANLPASGPTCRRESFSP